jgi:hypothetical protein
LDASLAKDPDIGVENDPFILDTHERRSPHG